MSETDHTRVFCIDGREISPREGRALMGRVVNAELDHWVPGASQRLIARAGAALGFTITPPAALVPDHGPDISNHATIADWIGDVFVRRCVTCGRLFGG